MDYGKKVQIHNFVMVKYKADKTSFVKVSSVNGDWSVSYREDNIMFMTIDMADESQHEGLYNVLVGMYGACNTVDSEFTKDLFDSLNRFYGRLKELQKPATEEEDSKVLDEERKAQEMKESFKKWGNDSTHSILIYKASKEDNIYERFIKPILE